MYKPTNEKFVLPTLGHGNLPHIVIGDFNSHNTTWEYTNTAQYSQVVACNVQQLLHSEQDPNNMEEIEDHYQIETRESICEH